MKHQKLQVLWLRQIQQYSSWLDGVGKLWHTMTWKMCVVHLS